MSEHIVENNPKKELLLTLGGVALFFRYRLIDWYFWFLAPSGRAYHC